MFEDKDRKMIAEILSWAAPRLLVEAEDVTDEDQKAIMLLHSGFAAGMARRLRKTTDEPSLVRGTLDEELKKVLRKT